MANDARTPTDTHTHTIFWFGLMFRMHTLWPHTYCNYSENIFIDLQRVTMQHIYISLCFFCKFNDERKIKLKSEKKDEYLPRRIKVAEQSWSTNFLTSNEKEKEYKKINGERHSTVNCQEALEFIPFGVAFSPLLLLFGKSALWWVSVKNFLQMIKRIFPFSLAFSPRRLILIGSIMQSFWNWHVTNYYYCCV